MFLLHMLIYDDSRKLKRLDEVESLASIKEGNAAMTAKMRIPDQDILENREAALGWPMQPSEFIRRIEKLNSAIKIQTGGVRGAVAVRAPQLVDGKMELKYISGFYVDQPLPEFSCVVLDDKGLPFREVRGWRTVLLGLVKAKVLTIEQVDLTFGKPNGGRAILWQKQTKDKRS